MSKTPAETADTATVSVLPSADAPPRHRWWILAVIGVAQLMVVLDATIVNIALPSAQKDLGFSDGDRQWVVTAYALAFGSLLLLGGRIGDLFGRKMTFLVGLVGFAGCFRTRWRRDQLRDAHRRPCRAGRVRRAARPGRPGPADHDLHQPQGTRQGLRRLRRDSRMPVEPSACSSAACSPSTPTGAGPSTSTSSSPPSPSSAASSCSSAPPATRAPPSTSPVPSSSAAACSAWSTASPTPRATTGAPYRPGAGCSPAPRCSPRSPGGRPAPPTPCSP